jgi:hypothetical protein
MSKVKKNDTNAKKSVETVSVESSQVAEPDEKVRVRKFKSHDLSELPEEALPFKDVAYKGSHSYTVTVQGAAPWIKPVPKAPHIKSTSYIFISSYTAYNLSTCFSNG